MTELLMKTLPWILLSLWFLYSLIIIVWGKARNKISNIYIIESIPNVFVTLGLLGTFLGITYGLLKFNTDPDFIKGSIKELLDGLKTAMWTSIAGIICSLIFARIIQVMGYRDKFEEHESSELKVLREISNHFSAFNDNFSTTQHDAIIKAFSDVLDEFNEVFMKRIGDLVDANFKEMTESIDRLTQWQKDYKDDIERTRNAYEALVMKHQVFIDQTDSWVNILDKIAGETGQLNTIINNIDKVFGIDGSIEKQSEKMKESVKSIKESTNLLKAMTQESFDNINGIIDGSSDKLETLFDELSENVNGIIGGSSDKLETLFDELSENINGIIDGSSDKLETLFDELSEKMNNNYNALNTTNSNISDWTTEVQKASNTAGQIISHLSVLQGKRLEDLEKLDENFNNRLGRTFATLDALLKKYLEELDKK